MPKDTGLRKVLVIGSGPIVIGQGAEFDYAGTQACRVLREEGVSVVLVNSNPATIMTDAAMADAVYLEPLTPTIVRRIVERERPDGILSGLGGQTGLTLCMQLAREGFLDAHGVRLLGSSVETIDRAEDRQLFKDAMQRIGQPVVPSAIATKLSEALAFADAMGYPVIVRPAFTLGGSGGGIANDEAALRDIAAAGIAASPIGQILVEQSVAGYKEIEFEVMRDRRDNAIAVCSMENFDPVGVHTGDSIVIAPAVTLADREYQMLRSAALAIVRELGVEGGCNVQFALSPDSFDYRVIEVNPRVSRSSALASKATGYPIAKVAAKIALGYSLDEIPNAITGRTFASFEPALDYVAVKFPKWPFDKFVHAHRELGTQMKATGEVMAIDETFEAALRKAVRGAEIGLADLRLPKFDALPDDELWARVSTATDERLFAACEALRRGRTIEDIHAATGIDRWFLHALTHPVAPSERAIYKMVDTCAAEFAAQTPYFYAVERDGEDEAADFVAASRKQRVLVLGSGPIRIGQGIEFDYACVHCVETLKKQGYEVIVVNNNPETVSTDFDIADRLYFEPLTLPDVLRVVREERPIGAIVAFGGGTAIKLARPLHEAGVAILGSSADCIDLCEDRSRFDALLEGLDILRPDGRSVTTLAGALDAARDIGYPVLLRPSYVLGGQNMVIAFAPDEVAEYMGIILASNPDRPVLVDKYVSGREIEVDAICDGTDVLLPGILEHVERTGVHSGDSIAVYPSPHVEDALAHRLFDVTKRICLAIGARGLINIQYILTGDDIYVIEVNPRASRTVPFLSKVAGVPMCELATRASLGHKLVDMGYGSGIYCTPPYVSVKVPVFSFEKIDVDTQLGPEMKSTGEVLGIGKTLREAMYKGLTAAGYALKRSGGAFLSVRDADKAEISAIAKQFADLGFALYATRGTARTLAEAGLPVAIVEKIHASDAGNTMSLLESGQLSYIICTSDTGRDPRRDDVRIRRRACELRIPCLTSIDTADAVAKALRGGYAQHNLELVNINRMRRDRVRIDFTKMQGAGNDYIYIDCFDREVPCPESLSVMLSERHYGVGGDGVVLIERSDRADAYMRMFNQDGSEGAMCGNAIRCVAKYLYDARRCGLDVSIDTKSGVKRLRLGTKDGVACSARVDMGAPELSPARIPVNLPGERVVDVPIAIGGEAHRITCVSMGNPHAVVFVPEVDGLDLRRIGPAFETDALFPDRTNTEFIQVVDDHTLKMRVWERGSGETMACGTGACAAVVAAVLNGHCRRDEDIRVILLGGDLTIRWTQDTVYMTGDCAKVFEGTIEI